MPNQISMSSGVARVFQYNGVRRHWEHWVHFAWRVDYYKNQSTPVLLVLLNTLPLSHTAIGEHSHMVVLRANCLCAVTSSRSSIVPPWVHIVAETRQSMLSWKQVVGGSRCTPTSVDLSAFVSFVLAPNHAHWSPVISAVENTMVLSGTS